MRFWFRPNWSTGAGPWSWGRLLEAGAYTPDGSYGFWALFLNPSGDLLQFYTQGDGAGGAATAASVNWTAGTWYQITVTYGSAASAIYVDGVLAATGTGVSHFPSAAARTATGWNLGSDWAGNQRVNGQIEELETFNHELDAATIEAEYNAMRTPSENLDVSWSGLRVNTPLVTGAVRGRPTAQMAVRMYTTEVESPDFTGLWGLFLPAFTLDLGTGEGPRYVWVGFRGVDNSGQPGPEVWRRYELVLDTTPPVLTITEPVGTVTMQPVIQVRGRANEPVREVRFDWLNANGAGQNEMGLMLPPILDAGTGQPVAWPFQLFDVTLATGPHTLTLRATDLAGNTTMLPLTLTLDLESDTTPPAITLHWPLDGTAVAADAFDLRGQVDDPCASVSVSGLTNEPVEGLVERDGRFWVEGLPLPPGSHTLSVTATDAAGNTRSQTLTVTRSPVTLTLSEPTETELAQASLTVTGTISEGGYAVWVNGVRAGLTPNGAVWNWQAEAVPLGEEGTAVLQARAIPLDHNAGAGDGQGPTGSASQGNPSDSAARDAELQRDRPARVCIGSYEENLDHQVPLDGQRTIHHTTTMRVRWGSEDGVRQTTTDHPEYGRTQTVQLWPAYDDTGVGIGCQPPAGNCAECVPESYAYLWALPTESCTVNDFQPGSCSRRDTYRRRAQTTLLLDTGGKSRAFRRHLFGLAAAAYAPHSPRLQPPYGDAMQRLHAMNPIALSRVRVLNQLLGDDGYLWCALPDGATLEVTPRTDERFYYLELTATKHKLVLTADGHDLEQVAPAFCVGERVDFVARLEPPLPPAALRTGHPQWFLPEKFVNKTWQHGRVVSLVPPVIEHYGSVNYRRNDALLKRWHTFCWYVNRPGGTVRFGAGLQFKNGQYVTATGKGEISIYRPEVLFTDEPPSIVSAAWVPEYRAFMLQLGPTPNDMEWSMHIKRHSSVEGEATYTQLVLRQSTGPNTGGRERLDALEFMYDRIIPVYPFDPQQPRFTHQQVHFDDNPMTECRWWRSQESISDNFKAYLRFRPKRGNPAENIFVTLRRVDWQWSGVATNAAGEWTVTSSSVPARPLTPIDTDELPEWDDVFAP